MIFDSGIVFLPLNEARGGEMSAEETLGGKAKPAERYFAAWFGMASGSAASFAGTRSGKRFPKKNGRKNGTDRKAFSEYRKEESL